MTLGSRARVLTLGALLQWLGACETPAPTIRSISVERLPERTAGSLVLSTHACTPPFDLDRGALLEDPQATLRLEPGALVFAARRIGDERFETGLPDDLLPGSYTLLLELRDGRRALYPGRFEVVAHGPTIERVESSFATVGAGDTGVDLTVTVSNPSLCAVESFEVVPRFLQNGVDVSARFLVQGPAPQGLAPGSRLALPFRVDVTTAARPGEVRLDAFGRGLRDGGPGCGGAVEAISRGPFVQWLVLSATQQALRVTDLQATPHEVRPRGVLHLQATVRNDSASEITVDTLRVRARPAIVALSPGAIAERAIEPGASRTYPLQGTVDDGAAPGTVIELGIEAAGRNPSGELRGTAPGGATAQVVVSGRR